MNTTSNEMLAVNTLRLAHDFIAAFTIDPNAAIAHIRVSLDGMNEHEVRQWSEHLDRLLVRECTKEQGQSLVNALESMDEE